MSLREYHRKRDFKKTPEPSGNGGAARGGRAFVVQKHDASRLHYDFRLELDGTLKSWAVPKGPSLDPTVKSLAVHVEDHPLDYAGFEGVIPEGEYGGGTVMVWDQGTWEPEGNAAADYRKGKLKFTLQGEKLHGSWALVRMGGRAGEDGKNWLLIKHRDDEAKPVNKFDVAKREPLSVVSGRDLPEIAADADRVWSSNRQASGKPKSSRSGHAAAKRAVKKRGARSKGGSARVATLDGARKATQPTKFSPQLATLATDAPEGDDWLHELKFDGYRLLAHVKNGRVRLITRRGLDWTHKFEPLAAAIGELPVKQAIFDGEVVALNDEGESNFQQLQNSLRTGNVGSLVYYVFDMPHCDGYSLMKAPLTARKEALASLLLSGGRGNDGMVRYSDHIVGNGATVLEQACERVREGIVSKRADARYESSRSRSWLKVKCIKRQEFVIGGYTKPSGARVGFGALALGYYDGGKFNYCGRVGTGFTTQSLRQLTRQLRELRTDKSPFDNAMTATERRGVTWVRPILVAEVEFTEWTGDGRLRHPSFMGLREDKTAKQVKREEAAPMPRSSKAANGKGAVVAGVTLSHPERVLFPEMGITKQDLAEYYAAVAEWMLPQIVDRPLTLVRCPAGRTGQCFYQKHLKDSLPEALRGVKIKEKSGTDEYPVVDDLAGLVSLVQMGVLEMHPWPARADDVETPDRIVMDLDPGEGVEWKSVVTAAREMRDLLGELGLESFVRTSGGKGLHVVAPLSRRNSWDQLKTFAHALADTMERAAPDRYIATMSKEKRRGKIYVDYLRNQRGATAIASYSTRARAGAPVATPLTWQELTARIKPNGFTVENLPKRLAKLKADPWDEFFNIRQSITVKMEAALE